MPGGFPLPQTPVGTPGILPRAADLTFDMIAPVADSDCGGLAGCGCAGCAGMGAFDMASLEGLIPGSTFGIANTYLALGAVLALVVFSASRRGRR